MKNYKQYYSLAESMQEKNEKNLKIKWWENKSKNHLSVKGDYIETVHFLAPEEKNDSAILENHTNVHNKEWNNLLLMMSLAVVDWCNENGKEKTYSFLIDINKNLDENKKEMYEYTFKVKEQDKLQCTDKKVIDQFDECAGFLTDMFYEFVSSNWKNLPVEWNEFAFGISDISESCAKKTLDVGNTDYWMQLTKSKQGEVEEMFVSCI